jgi:hypothetical protein
LQSVQDNTGRNGAGGGGFIEAHPVNAMTASPADMN